MNFIERFLSKKLAAFAVAVIAAFFGSQLEPSARDAFLGTLQWLAASYIGGQAVVDTAATFKKGKGK